MRRLVLTHFAGNALLLWLGYYWLGIGESRMATLAWSVVMALALVAGACLLYGNAFAFFGAEKRAMAVRNLPPLMVAAVALLTAYVLLAWWDGYSATPATRIASWFTLTLRRPVHPATVLMIFGGLLWLVRWAVLPALALPMLGAISTRGWRGFGAFGARAKSLRYWAIAVLLVLAGLWYPLRLLAWVPQVGGFGWEAVSFALRAGLAYLLFVGAGLALARHAH